MYIKECLPLGLTQMVQPLLCNSDMLDALPTSSMACGAPIERALPVSCNPSMFMAPNNHNQQISTSAASPLVSQRSLQFQPYEQLKRNLMTQIRIKRFNMLHKQIPEDLNFKDKHFCSLYLDSAKHNCCVGKANAESTPDIVETVTAKEFIAGLRRISTMPTLNHHSNAKAGLEQQSQRPSINQYSQLRQPLPTCLPSYRAKRLLSMREVQNIHYSLRPYPPQFGSAGIRDQQRLFQAFGYRPIPQTMTQLIAPSLVPPALFDTAAKLASDYLLQTQFSDFYRLAHYNITAREQRNVLAGSLVLLMLGLAVSAAMVLLKLSIAWRLFAVPMLLLALLLMTEVFTRVSVILWLTRRRSTALVFSKNMLTDYSNYNDTEKSMQSEQPSGTDIQAVQAITGTLRTSPMVGFAGTIHNTGFCSESRRCRFCIDSPYSGSHKRNTGLSSLPQTRTSSSLSLWSHPTIGSAVGSAFDRLVCFMLRKRNIGDQWHIDFHVQRYEVVERQVIRNQALIVFYQICVLLVLLTAALMALFLIA
ncbi:hypothetical protein J3B02_001391 [Coemansia erecta]|nr:hypothetical protein J3B02_001391 [Coemansia erecta]